jgi:hypothetical protein
MTTKQATIWPAITKHWLCKQRPLLGNGNFILGLTSGFIMRVQWDKQVNVERLHLYRSCCVWGMAMEEGEHLNRWKPSPEVYEL